MLSLSIFSSSQRISVALYERDNLKKYSERKIIDKKIDSIFSLLNKILKNNKKGVDRIYFSVGPGSYTALRSIKAIAQGISLFYKSEIINVTDFEIYLAHLQNNKNNALVFFEAFNKKFFYQYFKPFNGIYKPNSNCLNEDLNGLKDFLIKKKKREKKIVVISNSRKYFSFFKNIGLEKIIFLQPSADNLAKAVFAGYGSKKKEIIYHHTYYE